MSHWYVAACHGFACQRPFLSITDSYITLRFLLLSVMSKKDKILEMSARGEAPADIAEAVDTSESYVYKVRSEGNGETAASDNSQSDSSPAASDPTGNEESPAQTAAPDDPAEKQDLTFGDDPEPKEYDCGNCETGVPYLEKHCPECGEKLMWSKIDQ